jgi:putative membrane protein
VPPAAALGDVIEEEITVMYGYGDHMSGWGYALMTISTVVFWGLVITGIVLLIRRFGRGTNQLEQGRPTPEQLLAERFARGEINEDEYLSRLEVVRGSMRS